MELKNRSPQKQLLRLVEIALNEIHRGGLPPDFNSHQ
jgi:hypothetical protein